ncbi:unannotated protein [freshwater metagenome]|uniref:Unannotated protein n=1 Tax=freshwater metagenome TaxID=449393 RepID=A0A6J7C7U4_9ZZZZ
MPGSTVNRMPQMNVLGEELQSCSQDPVTGYYRTGCCENHGDDPGLHVVCIVCTEEFLTYSKSVGNDLSTPMPQYGFAGLNNGDQWCLCASRWQEAFEAGRPPRVRLASTHVSALEHCNLADLSANAVDR